MSTEIVVPNLGESIVEATIADWLKHEGDAVQAGEAVVVLETDKVDLDVGAEKSGVLTKIVAQTGDDVKVGDVIGVIDESAEVPGPGAAPESTEAATREPEVTEESAEQAAQTPQVEPVAQAQPAGPAKPAGAERATPVARRMAQEQGVDLSHVPPSGPRGTVTKEDVQRQLAAREGGQKTLTPAVREAASATGAARKGPAKPSVSAPTPSAAGVDGRREERVRMTRRRRTIAERLVEAQRTAAMLTTFNEVDMSAVMTLRKKHQAAFTERHGIKLGIVSFFVKTAIGALKAFPQVNAEMDGSDIVLKYYYDIGVAIGAEEGLVVPVLRDADRMPMWEIEQAIKDFAQRAEDGTLTVEELRGGTFTITNGGVFGSLLSTPILNPPEVAILGLHKIEDRPVVLDGTVVVRPMMYVALSYDHRVIDGREAVQFLVRIKELIEDPETLLLEI
jgi:2-oxoglutarate dehydrogenase E2 component (dihydrolipoamide succinyltransferase)